MTIPLGCAWCGSPVLDGFDHRACTAVRARPIGCLPLSTYHRGKFTKDGLLAWSEVIRHHVATVEDAAAAWAIEAGLDEDERAHYVVTTRQAAEELGWRQCLDGEADYDERKAMENVVDRELRLIAAHRSPDGMPFRGVL